MIFRIIAGTSGPIIDAARLVPAEGAEHCRTKTISLRDKKDPDFQPLVELGKETGMRRDESMLFSYAGRISMSSNRVLQNCIPVPKMSL